MKHVFTKSMERQLSLVELIRGSEEQTVKELGTVFQVDTKTVLNDIKEINKIIYPLGVVRSKELKYYLEIPGNYSFDFCYISFLRASQEFQLLEMIIKNESYTQEDLIQELFISLSSLRRMIKNLNQNLVTEGFQIESKPYRIRGDEKKISNFFVHYFKEKYTVTANFLSRFEKENLENIIDQLLLFSGIAINFNSRELATWITVVSVMRERHDVPFDSFKIGSFEAILKNYEAAPLLRIKFKSVFKIELTASLLSRAAYVVIQPNYAKDEARLRQLMVENPEVRERVLRIETILSRLATEFSITKSRKNVVLRLYNISISHLGDVHILNHLDRMFVEEIRQKWPDFVGLLENEYAKHSQYLANDQFMSFAFNLITEWAELTTYLRSVQVKMVVGLFFSTTEAHMVFVASELTRLLPDSLEIVYLSTDSEAKVRSKKIDVIVTNINNFTTEGNNICISRDITSKDIGKIANYYEKWLIEKNKERETN